MSKMFISFDIKTDIREAVQKMIQLKLSSILITSESKVLGIITSEDMLHLLLDLLNKDIETPTLLTDFVKGFEDFSQTISSANVLTTY